LTEKHEGDEKHEMSLCLELLLRFFMFLMPKNSSRNRQFPLLFIPLILSKFGEKAFDGRVTSLPRRSERALRGFSLLEVMLASALVLLLFFLAFTAFARVMESAAIDAGAQSVNDLLAEARQDAVAQNTTVEVRVYALPGTPTAYGSLQLWNKAAVTSPLLQPLILPAAAVIDATPAHSSLVTTNSQTPAPDAGDSRLNALTRDFHFLPDGSTDLASTGKWMLTLRAASKSNPANFPANWACIELDPVTGRTQIYRP
jgi:uncharacterized protein (TIGR02596 family)